MYTEFFSLKEKPFNLTPSPRFLYLSESHKEALALLTYGVMERKGFVLLTGEVGTGKTTILHTLLSTLDKRVEYVHLSNPLLSPSEFIDYLSHAVFKKGTGNQSKTEFLIEFEEYLRRSAQQQSNFLLVIDEAQKLSYDLLEEIRLLSNMETADQKLINIFLVGQPELNQKLAEVRCRPLLQRISIRHHISPLSLDETGEYVGTRLRVAGAKDAKGIFPAGALRAIHRLSRGYPRMINILADNSLLDAYSKGIRKVTARMVERCHGEMHHGASASSPSAGASWSPHGSAGTRAPAWGAGWRWWGTAAAAGAAAAALAVLAWNGAWTSQMGSMRGGYHPAATSSEAVVAQTPEEPLKTDKKIEEAVGVEKAPAARIEEVKAGSVSAPDHPEPVEERLETAQVKEDAAATSLGGEREEQANFTPEAVSPQANSPDEAVFPHSRMIVAKKGDTLSKLSVDVYGRVDERILKTLQKKNPSISNIHWIAVGQEIYFPPVRSMGEGVR